MSKRNYRRRFRDERNYYRYKNRGIDYWAAGIADPDSTPNIIRARILIQRLKHVVTGLHWYTDEYRTYHKYQHGYWGFKYSGDLPF